MTRPSTATTPPTARRDAAVTSEALKAWAAREAEKQEAWALLDDKQALSADAAEIAASRRSLAAHYRAVVVLVEDHANLRQAYGAAVQRLQALGETSVPLTINQCDGCRRGIPVVDGIHHDEQVMGMMCTADRYATQDEMRAWTRDVDDAIDEILRLRSALTTLTRARDAAEVVTKEMQARELFFNSTYYSHAIGDAFMGATRAEVLLVKAVLDEVAERSREQTFSNAQSFNAALKALVSVFTSTRRARDEAQAAVVELEKACEVYEEAVVGRQQEVRRDAREEAIAAAVTVFSRCRTPEYFEEQIRAALDQPAPNAPTPPMIERAARAMAWLEAGRHSLMCYLDATDRPRWQVPDWCPDRDPLSAIENAMQDVYYPEPLLGASATGAGPTEPNASQSNPSGSAPADHAERRGSEADQEPRIHGVTWLLVRDNCVLLERCEKKARVLGVGEWFVPGGKCNRSETPAQTLVREIREEWPTVQLDEFVPLPIVEGSMVPPGPRGTFLMRPYAIRVSGFIPNESSEGTPLRWVPFAEALESPVPQVRMMVSCVASPHAGRREGN